MLQTAEAGIERSGRSEEAVPRTLRWERIARRLKGDPVGVAAATVLMLIVLAALAAPLIAPYGSTTGVITDRLLPIGSAGHLLGTDQQGRDILSRILYGARASLEAGILPVIFATLAGGAVGVVAGFFRGWVGGALMRTMDVFYAFPAILLAIGIAAALGAGLGNAIMALSVVFVPPIARVTESAVHEVTSRQYMEAARASGARPWLTIRKQLLPNVLVPLGVYTTTLFGISVLYASGLSYLGLGVQSPHPEWGAMLNELKDTLYNGSIISIVPGAAIFVTCIAFNLTSDSLRDALDPETRR